MPFHSSADPIRRAMPNSRAPWIAILLAVLALTARSAEQPSQQPITPNFKDTDLAVVVEAVEQITGKTFIIDPRVRAQVTMLSTTPMSPSAFYQAFLAILQVHGFVAVPSGNVVKIIPDANARQVPADDLPDHVSSTSDEIVTQVIAVHNVSAAQLVPPLRPLIPQYGHLVSVPGANMLIISDRANNVSRLMRIIERIDQAGDDSIDIVQLRNASAAEIVRVVNTLFTAAAQQSEPGGGAKVVADDRTNSVLITGEQSQRLRLKTLVTSLDTPLETGGDTQVRYLRYADAKTIAGKLKEQITGIVQSTTPGGAAPAGGGGAASADRSVTLWADEGNNALVVTAPPKVMRQIMAIVDKIDIRRPQVLVEAILVEMNTTKAAEFGVNWAIDGTNDSGQTVPIGLFNQDVGGASIGSIAAAIQALSGSTTASATTLGQNIPTGLTLGGGRFQSSGINFAVLLRALRNDATTNVISTPSILTLDNHEAQIKVAQEVPFITGQFANTGATNTTQNGVVNPFQTIQREEVGTILKITPQISEGETVLLKIDQESSGIAQSIQGAADLITNKRTISTKVMVEDGGIIVLGGLLDDTARQSEQRVPLLGAIPLIGELFKVRNGSKEKNNLMLFIRPTILRDATQAAYETNSKYNALRELQMRQRKGKVPLLPGERQPTLPPLEEVSRFADPTKVVPEKPLTTTPPSKDKGQQPPATTTTAPLPEDKPSVPPLPPPVGPGPEEPPKK